MQIKLKTGKMVDLTEDEVKEILHMYKEWSEDYFDSDKLVHYFQDMQKKARMNLEVISDEDIESEKDMKDSLAMVMKYGSTTDVADYIIEAIEAKVSYMILQSMK